MGEREKIAQIIAEHLCPQGKAHKTLYGAERRCYSRDNFAECEKVSKCVDALIAAGIGDMSKQRLLIGKDGTVKQLYSGEEVEQIAKERDEYKHRVEVAERALINITERASCNICDNFSCRYYEGINYDYNAEDCIKWWLAQAEKELTEEKKDV